MELLKRFYLMLINKNTSMCISLAKKAGNFGCSIHNEAFKYTGLNFIYKSFSTENLKASIYGMRALEIRGAGITMPYKIDVLKYVDEFSEEVVSIGSANTVVNTNGILKAYNTDAFSAYETLLKYSNHDTVFILGTGGFSKAVEFSSRKIFKNVNIISRSSWGEIKHIKDSLIFNCTPVENIEIDKSNDFIDCLIDTKSGMEISLLQASKQFELYTGKSFPISHIRQNFNLILEKNRV